MHKQKTSVIWYYYF